MVVHDKLTSIRYVFHLQCLEMVNQIEQKVHANREIQHSMSPIMCTASSVCVCRCEKGVEYGYIIAWP